MTDIQVEAVQSSWDYVVMNVEDAGLLFYNKLFELDPNLRPLFSQDIEVQAQKLLDLLTFAVSKLDNLEEIVEDVKELGRKHKGYKVEPSHYATVASALLWTLEQGLGDQWTSEVKQAWIEVYTILSSVMIEAAESEE